LLAVRASLECQRSDPEAGFQEMSIDIDNADNEHRLRVGAVSYLNPKPLVYGLNEFAPRIDLSFDVPSRLADGLSAGRFDVALVPSIEYVADPSYVIISDACIGCRGPVLSVKLFARKSMSEVRTLALDAGSRSSSVLARILLEKRFGIHPTLEALPVGAEIQSCRADAILLIGDRAIHPPSGPYVECWDLGDQWCRWSELPFVFAMWVARTETDLADLESVLGTARDEGVANLDRIAAREAASVGLGVEQCVGYLRDNLHFYLGDRERRGLELYFRLAEELDLVERDLGFRSHDCRAT